MNVGRLIDHQTLYTERDEDRDCTIFDEDQVLDEMETFMGKGGNVVDFHSSDFFPERFFDLVFVLRTSNDVLYERLEGRLIFNFVTFLSPSFLFFSFSFLFFFFFFFFSFLFFSFFFHSFFLSFVSFHFFSFLFISFYFFYFSLFLFLFFFSLHLSLPFHSFSFLFIPFLLSFFLLLHFLFASLIHFFSTEVIPKKKSKKMWKPKLCKLSLMKPWRAITKTSFISLRFVFCIFFFFFFLCVL